MTKHIIKISIVLVWLGLMGWWWLESRSWPVPEKIDAAFLPDYNDYYGLSFGEQKIGWASKSLRRLPDGGYQGFQTLNIKLAVEDQAVDVVFSVTAEFDRVMNLTTFRYMVQSGPVAVTESGQVTRPAAVCLDGAEGDSASPVPAADDKTPPPCPPAGSAGSEGRLTINVSLGEFGPVFQDLLEQYRDLLGDYAGRLDFSRPVELSPPQGPGLMQFIPPYLSYLGLNTGSNYSMTMLDPVNRALTPVTVRVEDRAKEYDPETGRDIDIYRVRLGSAGGSGLLWLDRYGRTVREETLGFKMERVINLANKFDEQTLAAGGATPLKPPPSFTRFFSGREADAILNRIQRSVKPKQPGPGPEPAAPPAPAPPANPTPDANGEAHD